MEKTFSHRLYINEYNEEFVRQLSNNKIEGLYTTDESTNDVLVIEGTAENLRKLASLMYADTTAIKAEFPSFSIDKDFIRDVCEMRKRVFGVMREEIIKLWNKYDGCGVQREDTCAEAHEILHAIQDFYISHEIAK